MPYLYTIRNAQNKATMNEAITTLSKVDFAALTAKACQAFCAAAQDEGLSVEKTRQLMMSKEGMDTLAQWMADNI